MSERRRGVMIVLLALACGCGPQPLVTPQAVSQRPPAPAPAPVRKTSARAHALAAPSSSAVPLVLERLPLPGANAPVSLDYLFFEASPARIWIPAGGSGSVDVFDIASRAFTRIEGFKTEQREAHGKQRTLGPSSGAIGDGFAYVGNRATRELCAVDLQTLQLAACSQLASMPDGVAFSAPTAEVWVTAPRARELLVLQTSKSGVLRETAVIKLNGEPEGYAIDATRGLFLTNLEDVGTTLAIDLKSHAIVSEWQARCGSDGPRGIAVDEPRGLLLVACTDHVQVLDLAHDGALLGKLDTGAGIDNVDFEESSQWVYAAAGKAARLTIAQLSDDGQLSVVSTAETALGARTVVSDGQGNAYVADPEGARLLILGRAKH